ncbi:Rieske 2Fe-2S domain-containing protein [Ammoniphilus sp. YIM 78166]|uniref:Rieske 2Fe-2S domain-containing protein n=1 Tax=Ammoniphilus sp. YIM 78166 TaxID=1644106 RepID=UPI00106F28FC|nr:Rieske 2Fe-2S domain-containing protein [Ammoniphilus sp. YIM 78166]
MLKAEDNHLLTATGPGTPMGDLFRRYWIPALKSDELVADGNTVRIRLLGEDLVAFRDSEGKVGLLDERCPHRGTSMALGINDGCGLTCIYHGWKFDVNGTCTDLPSEPAESNFKNSISIKSYPIVERNGIVWTYMGSKETMPPIPNFYWMSLPDDQLLSERVWQECNYLQVMENDLDYVHAAFLHKALSKQALKQGILSSDLGIDPDHPLCKNPPVRQEVESTIYGKRCLAEGEGEGGNNVFLEIHYIFPFYTYPPRMEGEDGMFHIFVPRDDHSTWSWDVQFSHQNPIDVQAQHDRRGLVLDENFRKMRNKENFYEQDRGLMKDGNFSGIRGIANQDHAVTEMMGPIVDRSIEHLGTSDMPIIQMRRMLLSTVKDFMNGNEIPKPHEIPLEKLYSCGKSAPKGKTLQEVIPLANEFAPLVKK